MCSAWHGKTNNDFQRKHSIKIEKCVFDRTFCKTHSLSVVIIYVSNSNITVIAMELKMTIFSQSLNVVLLLK